MAVKITATRKIKKAEDTTGFSDEAGRARIETPQPGIDNAHRNKRREEGDGIPFTFLRPKGRGTRHTTASGRDFQCRFQASGGGRQASGMLSFILGNRWIPGYPSSSRSIGISDIAENPEIIYGAQ
jgi:hypothetical protein